MAAAEKKEEKSENTPGPAAGGGGGKLSTILGVVQLLLTLGIGAVLFLQFQKSKHQESVADLQIEDHGAGEAGAVDSHGNPVKGEGGKIGGLFSKKSSVVATLEQFTVNLATSPGMAPKFARVVIALDLPSDDTQQELNQKMAQARNSVIDLFNSKRPADLQSGEGRNFLKEEIKNALNSFLVSGKVKAVFFSNFAISS
jgi:flagellar protein FliL